MKFSDALRGHRPLTEEQTKHVWETGVFCLDTNVLLDVYRYSDEGRKDFFDLLGSIKDRLFVPARVADEFARNRVKVIRQQLDALRFVRSKLKEIAETLSKEHKKHPHFSELIELVEKMQSLEKETFEEREKQQLDLVADDQVLDQLLEIIGDDIGDPCATEELAKDYKRRQNDSIPPYCAKDNRKDEAERKGDVAVWLEVLTHSEALGKPLIFVTRDTKVNWWKEMGGHNDPQPALVQEYYERVKCDVLFYTSERFTETAPGRLGVTVSKDFVEETKELRQQDRDRRDNSLTIEWTSEDAAIIRRHADFDSSGRTLLDDARRLFWSSPEAAAKAAIERQTRFAEQGMDPIVRFQNAQEEAKRAAEKLLGLGVDPVAEAHARAEILRSRAEGFYDSVIPQEGAARRAAEILGDPSGSARVRDDLQQRRQSEQASSEDD